MNPREVLFHPFRTVACHRLAVPVAEGLQRGIARPAVRTDSTVSGTKASRRAADAPDAVPVLLDSDCHRGFLAPGPSERASFPPAHIDLVHLDTSGQPVPSRMRHCAPQLVEPSPSCPVRARAWDPLRPERADAVLPRRHPPDRPEPQRQRPTRALEDCADCHRGLLAAGGADQPLPRGGPARPGPAARASESVGSAQLGRECPAGPRGRELRLEVAPCPRVIPPHDLQYNI